MPYCPKCGVELDYKIKNCPLCSFPIPEILEDKKVLINEDKFPNPENIYYEKIIRLKNQIFFTISILIFSAILILSTINSIIDTQYAITYSIVSVISAWFYIFILFGYIKNRYLSIICMGIITFCLTFSLDNIDDSLSWHYSYALPITILSVFTLLLLNYLYNKSKSQNKFIFIPAYLCIGISLFSASLECILDYQKSKIIALSWSLIVFIVLMSIALILIGLYYKLPDKIKEEIKRKLHI